MYSKRQWFYHPVACGCPISSKTMSEYAICIDETAAFILLYPLEVYGRTTPTLKPLTTATEP